MRTRTIECRDGVGAISRDCDPAERPHTEQECKTNIACPTCNYVRSNVKIPIGLNGNLILIHERVTLYNVCENLYYIIFYVYYVYNNLFNLESIAQKNN